MNQAKFNFKPDLISLKWELKGYFLIVIKILLKLNHG